MATRASRAAARTARDRIHTTATTRGHQMTWILGPDSTRDGHAYHYLGECSDCGACATAGAEWSSCPGVLDARTAPCSGPGTAALTEIEAARARELAAAALTDFLGAIRLDGGAK